VEGLVVAVPVKVGLGLGFAGKVGLGPLPVKVGRLGFG
jgi:hypothetical protein